MVSPFIRHAYLEDQRLDRETVFVILAEDYTHSRLMMVNEMIIEAPVVGKLELRYIPLDEAGHPSALNYVHAGDPDNCSVHEAKICVSVMFTKKKRDGSVFVPPICYRAYLRMEEKDESPVDMSLIPLCVRYNAEHFITAVKMWNSTLDSIEALQAVLNEDNADENKMELKDIVD